MQDKAREILDYLVDEYLGQHEDPSEWQIEPFEQQMLHQYGVHLEQEVPTLREVPLDQVPQQIFEMLDTRYAAKEDKVGAEVMRGYERHILLQIIDSAWKDHLLAMDHLKDGIGLRAYGQRDPLVEYKKESFEMFSEMKERIENDAVRFLYLLDPMTEEERRQEAERRRKEQEAIFRAASQSAAGVTARGGVQTVRRKDDVKTAKVGRNAPCPCGSGKKYKKCHGAAGAA